MIQPASLYRPPSFGARAASCWSVALPNSSIIRSSCRAKSDWTSSRVGQSVVVAGCESMPNIASQPRGNSLLPDSGSTHITSDAHSACPACQTMWLVVPGGAQVSHAGLAAMRISSVEWRTSQASSDNTAPGLISIRLLYDVGLTWEICATHQYFETHYGPADLLVS